MVDSSNKITLAALQLTTSSTLTASLKEIYDIIDPLFSKKLVPNCIVLPEYAFGTFKEWIEAKMNPQEQFHKIKEEIASLCKTYNVAIVLGSIPHREANKSWRNRSYLFSTGGKVIGYYDKQHPFRTEKRLGLTAGSQTPIFSISRYQMAILICSDLWYSSQIQEISSQVDFIAVPTMTTVLNQDHIPYGRWVWHSLVAVRAKENTIPIVSADQTAREYVQGVFTCGASCIADPSHRFTEAEGPYVQALKIASSQTSTAIVSTMSLNAIRAYRTYREEVGLREKEEKKR